MKKTETHNVVWLSFFCLFGLVLFKKWMNTEKSVYLKSEEYPFLQVLHSVLAY